MSIISYIAIVYKVVVFCKRDIYIYMHVLYIYIYMYVLYIYIYMYVLYIYIKHTYICMFYIYIYMCRFHAFATKCIIFALTILPCVYRTYFCIYSHHQFFSQVDDLSQVYLVGMFVL